MVAKIGLAVLGMLVLFGGFVEVTPALARKEADDWGKIDDRAEAGTGARMIFSKTVSAGRGAKGNNVIREMMVAWTGAGSGCSRTILQVGAAGGGAARMTFRKRSPSPVPPKTSGAVRKPPLSRSSSPEFAGQAERPLPLLGSLTFKTP